MNEDVSHSFCLFVFLRKRLFPSAITFARMVFLCDLVHVLVSLYYLCSTDRSAGCEVGSFFLKESTVIFERCRNDSSCVKWFLPTFSPS